MPTSLLSLLWTTIAVHGTGYFWLIKFCSHGCGKTNVCTYIQFLKKISVNLTCTKGQLWACAWFKIILEASKYIEIPYFLKIWRMAFNSPKFFCQSFHMITWGIELTAQTDHVKLLSHYLKRIKKTQRNFIAMRWSLF